MDASDSFSVPTARGPVDGDELGFVLSHEHLFVWNQEFHQNFPGLWNSAAGVDLAVAQLEEAYEHGVRTVVDMTVLGQGRDPGLISQVAARTRVNLVLATGVYVLDGLPQIVRYRGPGEVLDGPDPLLDLLEADIRDGIAGTGVRAALVKFACEKPEPDATVRRLAAAVAEVQRRTGVPIVVHTDPVGRNALAVLDVLRDLGVDPRHVALAHAGDITDYGYLSEVAATGAFIGCDRFGMQALLPDAERIATITKLIDDGHIEQLLLSHDCASFIDHFAVEQRAAMAPEWSYSHIHLRILPQLRDAGIDDDRIGTLFTDNPKRLLRPAEVAAPA
jgi:phosphotriesterase-related protein